MRRRQRRLQTHGTVYAGRARQHRCTNGAVAGRMLTPKDDQTLVQSAHQAAALCHTIVALADKAAILERPDGKLRKGASGDGDAPGGGSGDAGLEDLLVLTHGAAGARADTRCRLRRRFERLEPGPGLDRRPPTSTGSACAR